MHWFQSLDATLFHWVNPALSNPVFDVLMPFASDNPVFAPALFVAACLLMWKGGARGRICVLMLVLAVALGDTVVCNTLKQLIQRPRPFLALSNVHIPVGVGRSDSGSMPSSHAANWFAAAMVAFIYYPRSLRLMLPLALIVCFSRIYNGVHYPGDVLAGAILGAGYAACGVWSLDGFWRWAGGRWFPLWWQQLPSLLNPETKPVARETRTDGSLNDQQWMRLGYFLIFAQLAANLAYIASGTITLSEDEAYQWIWSKHLALSYYSKPPLIALIQSLGTWIWGDTVFGVRFFSPIIATLTAIPIFRFLARVANVRAAFWMVIIMSLTPLLSIGSILMTIDPPSCMFWALAMIAGWDAIQEDSTERNWLWVGLWMGLGFLSKYTALFQWLSWAVLFTLYPAARRQLRRPGPYLALLVNLVCAIPVLIWNHQNGWITIQHVSQGGNFDKPWAFTLANLWHGFARYTTEFVGEETGLLNPFFFWPAVVAAVVFWRRASNRPLLVYFFSMGAPLFLFYLLLTFHSRSLPNWIAPSIVPMFCLAVVYWEERWRQGFGAAKKLFASGVIFGCAAVLIVHAPQLIPKLAFGWRLPADKDPTRRVRGWAETAQAVEAAREKLLAEGKPVFIIGGHYGITGELTFNLPEAKAGVPDHPLVYYVTSPTPMNQFFFWPGYRDRTGQNAIYVQELELFGTNTYVDLEPLQQEFESVTDLGWVTVTHDNRPIHRVAIVECRGLRPSTNPAPASSAASIADPR